MIQELGALGKWLLLLLGASNRVKGVRVQVKRVSETSIKDLAEVDGIILGSPTYYSLISDRLEMLLDKSVKVHGELEGKVGAAFASSGGTASGAETTLLSIVQALLIHGMIVQGRANSRHYGASAVGAPNREDLKSCVDLGKRTACLVMKLK